MAKFAVRVIEKLTRIVVVENVITLEEAIETVQDAVNKDRLIGAFGKSMCNAEIKVPSAKRIVRTFE